MTIEFQQGTPPFSTPYTRFSYSSSATEDFTYDAMYRLETVTLNGQPTLDMDYDAIGNITKKNDVSSSNYLYTNPSACSAYAYSYSQPHAVRQVGTSGQAFCYDANGNMGKRGTDAFTWCSYNLPSSLVGGSNSSQFYYGASRQRYKQVNTNAGVTQTTIYVGGIFEKVTQSGTPTAYKHYVQAAGETVALYTRYSSGAPSTVYLFSDHLGSVDKITDSAGSVLVGLSYNAFGRRRKSDWTAGDPTSAEWTQVNATTHRGFTNQEELDNLGFIHMNGRVYNPYLGRFLSQAHS